MRREGSGALEEADEPRDNLAEKGRGRRTAAVEQSIGAVVGTVLTEREQMKRDSPPVCKQNLCIAFGSCELKSHVTAE
jgi:hypothetical protein